MAVITLGSPSFDPTPLVTATTPVSGTQITIVGGATSTAMIGESDPIFTAWDRTTGITINSSQINTDDANAVPTSLSLSSSGLNIAAGGAQSAYVIITWDAITSSNFNHYNIRYKKAASTYYSYVSSTTNTIEIGGLIPNTSYNFGVSSVNTQGTSSVFCTSLTLTTTLDTTLPATVTGVSATANFQSVKLIWSSNSELDLASYNIYRHTSNASGSSSLIANCKSNYFTDVSLTAGTIQWYWVKAVDTSGNISAAYSTSVSATPTNIREVDILDSAITAAKTDIAAINPVDGEINANKVGTTQLDDNAVSSAKIQNDAITALKLNIAAIHPTTGNLNINTVGTSQITAGSIEAANLANDAIESWAIADNAVLGPAIASDAVVARHILAGEISADHIATGALTARHITSANFVIIDKDPVTDLALFTSNDPGAGSVSWINCVVMYNGVQYSITDDDTTDTYIYWEYEGTTFSTSATLPTLGNNDFLVATNTSGTHLLAWNSTTINGNRITTGSITATQIGANAITAIKIDTGAITSDKISAGAVTANKITSYNFVVSAGTFTADSPTLNKVAWSNCKVVYNGTEYTITDDSCLTSTIWIYWEGGNTTFSISDTLPVLNDDDFLVASVEHGDTNATYTLVWNSTRINGNRITAGSINATHIAANTITSEHIAAGTIVADNIKASEIEAYHLSSAAGATFTHADGGSYTSDSSSHPRIRILPDTTIGFDATDSAGSNVFRIDVGGSNPGDVTIGDYAGGQGILYDASANATYFAGHIAANTGLIGEWNIDEDSIYSGTKKTDDGYSVGAGSITIKSDGSIHAPNFYIDTDGETSIRATNPQLDGVYFKTVDIGDWDMNTDEYCYVTLTSIVSDFKKIRNISVLVRNDADNRYYLLDRDASGGVSYLYDNTGNTVASLFRVTAEFFDSTDFDSTSYNRGWITLQFVS